MASTFSDLKIELIGTGDQTGTWGTTTNNNFSVAFGEAITGSADVVFSGADVTVTLIDTNAAQTARNLRLNLTGTSGGARNLILGSGCQIEKLYLINNGLADVVTVKNTTGTGIAVPAGKSMFVFNNGTDVVEAINSLVTLDVTTLDATNIEVTNIKAKDGTASATIANSTGVMTVASAVLTTADINGGTIDGAVIGGSTAAAGNFTTLGASSTATLNTLVSSGATLTGGSINNMAVGATTASTGRFSTLEATGVSTFSAGTAALPAITTTGDTNTGIFFPAADTIAFTEGGVESMRIDSSGNVGIGISSPTQKLVVAGGRSVFRANSDLFSIQVEGASGAGQYYIGATNEASPSLVFSNVAGTERMRITSAGDVGIGISNPGGRLDIAGVGRLRIDTSNDFVYQTILNAAGNAYKRNIVDALQHEFYGSATERMRIDSSGNVGIGTSAPTAPLQVTKGTTGQPAFLVNPVGLTNFAVIPSNSSGTGTIIGTTGADTFAFMTNTTERMRIDNAGNVGIGTSSPAGKLDLNGDAVAPSTTANNGLLRVQTGISNELQIGANPTSPFGLWIQTKQSNNSGSVFPLLLNPLGGDVGIGTSSPSGRLDVVASDARFNLTSTGSGQTVGISIKGGAGGGDNFNFIESLNSGGTLAWSLGSNGTANTLAFKTNGNNERMRIDSSGNLLLAGTATPATGVGTLAIFNGTAPTASVTNGIVLYAEDVSSSSELKVRDEAGNVTTLSPHNFSMIPEGASEDMAWAHYSERNGKRINVDMLKLARMVEKLTGEKLVYTEEN